MDRRFAFLLMVLTLSVITHNYGTLYRYTIRNASRRNSREIDFWVDRYLRWHADNRFNATRRAIYRSVAAGLGDNIKGILNLYAYSVLTERLFLIPCDDRHPLCPFLSTDAVRKFSYSEARDKWASNSEFQFVINGGKSLTTQNKRLLAGATPTIYAELGPVKKNQPSDEHLVSSLRKGRPMIYEVPAFSVNVRRNLTKTIFQPSESLRNAYIKTARNLSLIDRPYITVHARLGLVVGERGKFKRRFSGKFETIAECFSNLLCEFLQTQTHLKPLVFLATDTPDYIPFFQSKMASILPGTIMKHLDERPMHYNHIGNKTGNSTKLHLNIHLESLLMAHSIHIISFPSGFADISYWRGNASSHQVVEYSQCGLGP